jgi:hypothetical protein
VNWYKKAQSNIKQALSRLSKPDIKGVDKKIVKLWNYLKSKNITHTFYHGTSAKIYNDVKETGYMMSPTAKQTEHYEKRISGLDQIFYTTSTIYAETYAKRASGQTASQPVLLKLEIPVHLITEVKNAILSPNEYVYNEYDIDQTFNEILNENLSEKGIEEILNHKLFISGKSNEFTTYMALPTKYITDSATGSFEINMFIEEEDEENKVKKNERLSQGIGLEETERDLRLNPQNYKNISPENREKYPQLFDIAYEGSKYYLERSPSNWNDVLDEFKEHNDNELYNIVHESWKKHLIDNPDRYESVPEEFKTRALFDITYFTYKKKLILNPYRWGDVPVEFKTEELRDITYRGWKNVVSKNPGNIDIVPEEFKETEELRNIAYEGFKERLIQNPREYRNSIPQEFQNEELFAITLEGWKRKIIEAPWGVRNIPDIFRNKLLGFLAEQRQQWNQRQQEWEQQEQITPQAYFKSWYKKAQSYNTVEEAIDWLKRSGISMEGDKYVFYHGSPKENNLTELRAGSLLEDNEKDARHFAAHNRYLKPEDIVVYKVLVNPEDINTGVFASLNKSYKL